jgi:hypothetical protein
VLVVITIVLALLLRALVAHLLLVATVVLSVLATAGVAALHRICDDVRFLGSYARADGRKNKDVPLTADDASFASANAWVERVRAGEAS